VVQVFTDNDVSAFDRKVKRPSFEALLVSLAGGELDTVVVWKTDRLARRGRDLQRFLDACEPNGATLTSCTEPEFAGPTGLLMLRVVNSFAEHESSVKSERVARANRERAHRGEPHGGGRRVFGYTRVFEPFEPEAMLVTEGVHRLLHGESNRAIVKDWNARGITTVAGGQWSPGNLARMMRAPVFAGLRAYHGELLPGAWPALVARREWDMLQVILAARLGPHKAVTRHLLTGLTRCGGCGARMFGTQHHGHVEYRCNKDRNGCGRVSIRSSILEPEVLRLLFAEAPRIAKRFLAPQLRSHIVLGAKLAALDEDVAALDELHTARFVDRSINQQAFLRAKAQLDARIASKRAEIGQENVLLALSSNLELEWHDRPLSWRRQVLEATVKQITVRPGRNDRVAVTWLA
jgi:site-specific DNA recombinase